MENEDLRPRDSVRKEGSRYPPPPWSTFLDLTNSLHDRHEILDAILFDSVPPYAVVLQARSDDRTVDESDEIISVFQRSIRCR